MMPLLRWASESEDVPVTAGGAPLPLGIPAHALHNHVEKVAGPGAFKGWLLRLAGQLFVSRLGRDSPEIQGGVGAPGSPSRGAMLEFTGTFCCQGAAQQAEITRGKSIWLTEGSHDSILGRPFADAGNLAEAGRETPSKLILPAQTARARARMVSARAPLSPTLLSVAPARTSGGRKKMREATGTGERFSESACPATGQRGRSFRGNLLAENGTGGEFEAIPAAWHAQPRVGFDAGR